MCGSSDSKIPLTGSASKTSAICVELVNSYSNLYYKNKLKKFNLLVTEMIISTSFGIRTSGYLTGPNFQKP
ncbi:hypothetical protein BpHYR1_008212 [Brachionus plicatilis]|uniref:Uncharacterized protein n=1 Tax=Brachionus plicatilis TaxID=10195 RepID=A0A3M7RLU5_BRAPC|nr:hypothetical protein BpHYR1_008212 [Brachionus plicatilis]